MAGMREIKQRMKSIQETKQITKAMKLISAAKLKKARQQLDVTLPYFKKVKAAMADILVHSGSIESIYFDSRAEKPDKKAGFLILSGDKGLAGGYNHNLTKLAESRIRQENDPLLLIAGLMGKVHFSKGNFNVDPDFFYQIQNPNIYRSREISEIIIDLFTNHKVDEFYIVYTHMYSAMKLEPRVMKLLPLNRDELELDVGVQEITQADTDELFTYEPSPQKVLDILIKKYVKGIVYGTLVEAFTSEQSARMTAMDSATSNADEMLRTLNLFYNRARQAAITQEISEIVGGAAALK